jgi:hypothetical protein
MKKKILLIVIVLMSLFSFNGCAANINDFVVNAKTYFDIGVPNNSKIFFQAPWFRISATDYNKSNLLAGTFTVGDNVKLSGENVSQLDGAKINLTQFDLKDIGNSEYYKALLMEEDYMFNTNKYRIIDNQFVYPDEDEIKQTERLLEPYVTTAKILACNFVFYGSIDKPIRVDSIEISSLNFKFDFNTFKITPYDLPEDQTIEVNSVIDSYNGGGLLAGPSLSEAGYYFIEGKAKENIKEITNMSLINSCQVVNKDNHGEYEEYENKHNTSLYIEQKTTNFQKGDEINIEFNYLFEGIDPEEFKKYDSTMASIANVFILDDGSKLYNYIYQPSMRSAEYGLVHILHSLH